MAAENVYLFAPNLIGYARIILTLISCCYMFDNPVVCVITYTSSCLLDAVDGHAARAFNQCSRFGAVLDMVTDRCTTACLLCFLAIIYPKYMVVFQFLISLDMSSHYMHMYSSLLSGSSSHKKIDKDKNALMRLYYTSQAVLFSLCFGNEFFFVLLYVLHFTEGPIVNLGVASIPLVHLLLVVTFPIFALKQIINCIQFGTAAGTLVEFDKADRLAAASSGTASSASSSSSSSAKSSKKSN